MNNVLLNDRDIPYFQLFVDGPAGTVSLHEIGPGEEGWPNATEVFWDKWEAEKAARDWEDHFASL